MENITPPGTPAKRALAVLETPAPAEPLPALRITKKVRAAIDLLVSGDCKKVNETAEKVGLARESLSRALSKPHIAEFLRQKVMRSLALASARAGAVKQELLDCDNAMVRDRASTFVLGLAGIQPDTAPSVNVNIEMKAGYVIDLSRRPAAHADCFPMTDKPKRISAKVRAAVDAMVAGTAKTITDAADHAGLSREHLSRELSKPHVTEHLRQKIKRSLAAGAARAGVTKLALLDSPNEMVRDRASSYVLGLIGIVPDSSPTERSATQQPGLQIVIYSPGTAVPPQIIGPAFDALALPGRTIEHDPAA
jgi:DNA-binding phage protein